MFEVKYRRAAVLVVILVAAFLFVAPVSDLACQLSFVHDERVDDSLLEVGRAPAMPLRPQTNSALKVVSYNIRWRGGDDLEKLVELLRKDNEIGGAAILALQEVDRNRKRTARTNTGKLIAEKLGLHYAWSAPPAPPRAREEETGVAIMSLFPLADVSRIVLPHHGPGKRRRVAIGATVTIGKSQLRVYSVHSETRIAVRKKMEQLQAVLSDLSKYPKSMPAIIMGDFNTWEPDAVSATKSLFTQSGFQTPFGGQSTFCRDLFVFDLRLKLDWIWFRGLVTTSHGIDRSIKISDHWPLWAVLKNPDYRTS